MGIMLPFRQHNVGLWIKCHLTIYLSTKYMAENGLYRYNSFVLPELTMPPCVVIFVLMSIT